jgi:F0F1-type ATP synthase assembly protein I
MPERPMNPPAHTTGKPVMRGAAAGSYLVACILVCAGIGAGIGSLIDAVALLAILGVFAGLGAGFALVYSRYKDI